MFLKNSDEYFERPVVDVDLRKSLSHGRSKHTETRVISRENSQVATRCSDFRMVCHDFRS